MTLDEAGVFLKKWEKNIKEHQGKIPSDEKGPITFNHRIRNPWRLNGYTFAEWSNFLLSIPPQEPPETGHNWITDAMDDYQESLTEEPIPDVLVN